MEKSKNVNQLILMNVLKIFIEPFLLMEFILFSQNTESSIEQ